MAKAANKTKPTKVSATSFLAKISDKQQLADCRELTRLFRELTGKPAKMWGPSIVGFGSYHYVYPTGREGDAPLIGFAPRGNALSLYLCPYLGAKSLLKKLGKHKAGAGCVYIKTLDDIDRSVLKQLAKASIAELRRRYAAATGASGRREMSSR
jgi:hypothetical protein